MNFHVRQMSLWMKSLDINGREIRITSKEAVHLKYCQCRFSLRLSQLKSICTSETPPSCLLTHNSCAPSGSSTLMPGHTYVVRVPNPFFPSKALISQRALSQKKHVSCHRGEMDFKLLNKDYLYLVSHIPWFSHPGKQQEIEQDICPHQSLSGTSFPFARVFGQNSV